MTDIDKASEPFNIFKALDLAKIYLGENISLKVNSKIRHYERIIKLFERNHIPFKSYTPVVGMPNRFDIHFGSHSDFQDLYIIVAILKNFGLQSIFYSEDNNSNVTIGSYITEYGANKDISEGLSSDEFLKLPFYLTTNELLQNYFNVAIIDNIENSEDSSMDEDEEFEDYHDDYDNHDYYERESYGQYAGSHAQDVEGLSDDFINDVLDGDPDAYWNID